uniref:Transcription factor TFIIIB component B'' Myb domain-containing protein n=1 Tax=Glycine max TaxID=3847 RepID=K7LKJ3_SOYBN
MDPFDDVLPVAPAARSKCFTLFEARPGAKFIPKAKSKQLSPKEIPVFHPANAMHSEDAVHNGTIGKSSGEAADIFSATDTGKPALHSLNEKGAEQNFVTPASSDDVFHYQSMKSGEGPTSGIPVHEELTNAADNSNKRKKDGSTSCSLRKNRRSSIAGEGEEDKGGKTSRQLRKQAARKPANSSFNEDVEDNNDLDPPYNSNGDELQENDETMKLIIHPRKKEYQQRKKANDDLEKTEERPKKFSHSTRRRKRCVDKALLEIPEDELDLRQIPIKDIILLEEHREWLAKNEVMTSNTSSTNQSGGDSLHKATAYYLLAVAGAYNEGEFSGSEDAYDDQANEGIISTSHLFNHQCLMKKAPGAIWSEQDTQQFYEAVRMTGTIFSLFEPLFPGKTPHQIKLKFNNEDGKYCSRVDDAVYHFAKVKPVSTKAEEDPGGDASDFVMAEEVVDLTAGTHEVATTKEDADVKAQEDSVAVHSPEQPDDSDDDFQKWSQYESAL